MANASQDGVSKKMRVIVVVLLLTFIAAALGAEQLLPAHAVSDEVDDEYLEDALQQDSQELLADGEGEDQDDIAFEDASTVRYTYSQRSGRFTGKARDNSVINAVGCAGSRAGNGGFLTCRNEPGCQCSKDRGPAPRARFVAHSCFPAPQPPQQRFRDIRLLPDTRLGSLHAKACVPAIGEVPAAPCTRTLSTWFLLPAAACVEETACWSMAATALRIRAGCAAPATTQHLLQLSSIFLWFVRHLTDYLGLHCPPE